MYLEYDDNEIQIVNDKDIYYSKEVKGQRKFFDHFCKNVFTCVNIILVIHDFFSSG